MALVASSQPNKALKLFSSKLYKIRARPLDFLVQNFRPFTTPTGVRMRLAGGWEGLNWFAIFKHIFLSNHDSVFDSVWTSMLFRINATKRDLICIYFTYFYYLKKNQHLKCVTSTFCGYLFHILRILFQHFKFKCELFLECWISLCKMLDLIFQNVEYTRNQKQNSNYK